MWIVNDQSESLLAPQNARAFAEPHQIFDLALPPSSDGFEELHIKDYMPALSRPSRLPGGNR